MDILLGVGGGIAAYKAAALLRLLQQRGHAVRVVLTHAAAEFVQPLTFASLSGRPVLRDLFGPDAAPPGPGGAIEHIAVAQAADALVVAPATAHLLAQFAAGLAPDYLTTLYLAAPVPVVLAPAMNVEMWRHPATQANLATLRARGHVIVEPGAGYLACGMVGDGRMAEPEAIAAAVDVALEASHARRRDFAGESVLITAGPTREPLDAVRFVSNRSSGRMGYALAEAALARGARVTLVSGPVSLAPPAGAEMIRVETAEEMFHAAAAAFPTSTCALFAAAVADFRPRHPHLGKPEKTALEGAIELEPTRDILATLAAGPHDCIVVGFAAETAGLEVARAKWRRKRADLMVYNDVSQPGIGFDAAENAVTLLSPEGETALPRAPKRVIADAILDAALALRRARV